MGWVVPNTNPKILLKVNQKHDKTSKSYNYFSTIMKTVYNYISNIKFNLFCIKMNMYTIINIQIYRFYIKKIFRAFFEKSGQPESKMKESKLKPKSGRYKVNLMHMEKN